jgi:hypothetical protein
LFQFCSFRKKTTPILTGSKRFSVPLWLTAFSESRRVGGKGFIAEEARVGERLNVYSGIPDAVASFYSICVHCS